MTRSDEFNVALASDLQSVDEINGRFYGKYSFPWPPTLFESVLDPLLETRLLNHGIGSWDRYEIPVDSTIWVAGCGTNQGVITALRFPRARVIGTDLSATSIATERASASQLGLKNLEVRQESINDFAAREQFDYILCTGVIHHNANPAAPLQKLRDALKPGGICELMVYNRYHRTWTTAFQKAVQCLTGMMTEPDFELEMQVTRGLLREKINSSMSLVLGPQSEAPEASVADSCMQPVEHHYTVESLQALLAECGLEYLTPCVDQFSRSHLDFHWNMQFVDAGIRARYEALPDFTRWQITNLLHLERSPHLWFYVQRTDSGRLRKSDETLCNEFLDRQFRRVNVQKKVYVRNARSEYEAKPSLYPHPAPHSDAVCRKVLACVQEMPGRPMREVFARLNLPTGYISVNRLRVMLTTCGFPHLICTDMMG